MRKPIDIVVYVSGGTVQAVSTDLANSDGVRVFVVDYDNGDHDGTSPIVDGDPASVDRQLVGANPLDVACVVAIWENAEAAERQPARA